MKKLFTIGALVMAITLTQASAFAATQKYEAEKAELVTAKVMTDHTGFSGDGFAANIEQAGVSIIFTADAASAGEKTINIGYASGQADPQTLTLYVNDKEVKQLSFAPVETGNWDKWGTLTDKVTLDKGSNKIELKYNDTDTGHINIDYLEIASDDATAASTDSTAAASASSTSAAPAADTSKETASASAASSNPKTGDMSVIPLLAAALASGSILGFKKFKK